MSADCYTVLLPKGISPQQKEGNMAQAIATYANADNSMVIKVMDDISYEITRVSEKFPEGWTSHTPMSKWYIKPESVIKHIENDIAWGAYPDVVRKDV